MLHLSAFNWLLVGVGALLIGISKTGVPGMGILVVPLMAMVFPAKASTGVILPMLICADVFAVAYYRRHAVWPHLLRLIPWALAGIVIGWYLMGKVSDSQLKPVIAVIVLIMLGLHYVRQFLTTHETPIPTQWYFAAFLGLAAGITTMLANAAGPIMIIYLLAMRLPKQEFLGTGAWYYLLLNCVKVPFSYDRGLITPESFHLNLIMFPLITIGALAGIYFARQIPQKAFNITVQILAAAAAIHMLF
jgi:uncharacterized membrane protein YfcA